MAPLSIEVLFCIRQADSSVVELVPFQNNGCHTQTMADTREGALSGILLLYATRDMIGLRLYP